jgi:hypothetical protein
VDYELLLMQSELQVVGEAQHFRSTDGSQVRVRPLQNFNPRKRHDQVSQSLPRGGRIIVKTERLDEGSRVWKLTTDTPRSNGWRSQLAVNDTGHGFNLGGLQFCQSLARNIQASGERQLPGQLNNPG